MTIEADIVIQQTDGRLVAIVEVKNRQSLSRDIAMILRRNMIANGLSLEPPYFLLISQDNGFLGKQ